MNTPTTVESDSVFYPANQRGYTNTAADKLQLCLKSHMWQLCRARKIKNSRNLIYAVGQLTGRTSLTDVDAWEWLLEDFMTSNPDWRFSGFDNAVTAMRRGFRRVRIEAEDRRIAAERRAALLAAQQIPGSEFYQSFAWRELRYKVLTKRGAKCEVCGRTGKDHGVVIHVDHIFPRSEFPDLALEETNLQVMCEDCNIGKGTEDTTDWRTDQLPVDAQVER